MRLSKTKNTMMKQNENTKKCATCGYFACAIFCCLHPDNEGIRAFENTDACDKYMNFDENPMDDVERNKLLKQLFG